MKSEPPGLSRRLPGDSSRRRPSPSRAASSGRGAIPAANRDNNGSWHLFRTPFPHPSARLPAQLALPASGVAATLPPHVAEW